MLRYATCGDMLHRVEFASQANNRPASQPASQPIQPATRFLRNATRNADARDVSSAGSRPRCRQQRRRRERRWGERRGCEWHGHGILVKKARIEHSRVRPNEHALRTVPLRSAPLHRRSPLAAYLHEAATSRASVRFKGTERRLAGVWLRLAARRGAATTRTSHVGPLFGASASLLSSNGKLLERRAKRSYIPWYPVRTCEPRGHHRQLCLLAERLRWMSEIRDEWKRSHLRRWSGDLLIWLIFINQSTRLARFYS